ncbi:MAG: NAD kinase [Prevotellaceae bacterium]|jgi:NAD+ kinase|nr:NAD kinase [Prevotellaceae bacterium]
MKVAVYGRCYKLDYSPETKQLVDAILRYGASTYIYAPFYCFITAELGIDFPECKLFNSSNELDPSIDYMLSMGGDGTFLEAAKFVLQKNIPILGVNLGRLGFLAQASPSEITQALDDLFKNKYSIEKRCLLEVIGTFIGKNDFPHALNEVSVQRNTPVMIKTTVKVDNEMLSSYWSDGLLVSTPTGSTAYSLSVGGPIILPNSENFIITPIAPHNLNIRPIIISGDSIIEIEIVTRKGKANITIDNQMFEVESGMKFYIKRSKYNLNFIKLNTTSFFKTLQNKLHWGFDPRN